MDRRSDNVDEDWSQQDVAWDGLLLTSNASNGNDAPVPVIDKYYIKGRGVASGGAGSSAPSLSKCRVPGCTSDLNRDLAYFRKYRICREHLKSPVLIVEGVPSRFCQQCSRFHHVREFDGPQRTCRTMLERLRLRRNQGKTQPEVGTPGGGGAGSGSRGRDTRAQGDSTPGGSSSQSTSSGKKVTDQAQRATTSGSNAAADFEAMATAAAAQPGDTGSPGTSDPSCPVPQPFMPQQSYNNLGMAAATTTTTTCDLPSSNLSVFLNNNPSLMPLPRITPRGAEGGREQSVGRSFFSDAPYGLGAAQPPAALGAATSLMSPTASAPSSAGMSLRPPSGTRSPLDLTSRVAGDETLELQLQDIYREMAISESSHAAPARPSLYDKLTSLSPGGPLLPLRSSSLHVPPLPIVSSSLYSQPGPPVTTPPRHPAAPQLLGHQPQVPGGRVLATATAAAAVTNPPAPSLQTPVRGPAPQWQSYGLMPGGGRPPHSMAMADAMEFNTQPSAVPPGGAVPMGANAAGAGAPGIPAWQQFQPRAHPLAPQQHHHHHAQVQAQAHAQQVHPHASSAQHQPLYVADALPRHPPDLGPQHAYPYPHPQPSAGNDGGFLRMQPLPQGYPPQQAQQPQDPCAWTAGRLAPAAQTAESDRLDAFMMRSGSSVISLGSGISSLGLSLGSSLGGGAGGSLQGMFSGCGSGAEGGGTPAGAAAAACGGPTSSLPDAGYGISVENIDAALEVLMTEAGPGAVYHTPEEAPSLERLCLKLHHMHPRDLPPDLLAGMTSWLAGAPAELVQGAIRPGCTQLILDVYIRRIGASASGSLVQSGGEGSGNGVSVRQESGESLRGKAGGESNVAGGGGHGGEGLMPRRVLGGIPEAVAAAARAKGAAAAAAAAPGVNRAIPAPLDNIRVLGGALEACSSQQVEEMTRSDAMWALLSEPIAGGGSGSSGGLSSGPDATTAAADVDPDPVENLSAYVMHGGNVRAAAASFKRLLGQRAVQSMAASVRHQLLILSGPNDGIYVADSRGTLAGLHTPQLLDVSPRAVVAGGSCVLHATGAHLSGSGIRPHIRCQGAHVACSITAANAHGAGAGGGGMATGAGGGGGLGELGPQLIATATLPGSHFEVAKVNHVSVQVRVPAAPDAGLMMLEWEAARGSAGMAVSEWLPLLAVPEQGMAVEINHMATLRGPGDERLRRFLVDLGLLLDYTSRLAHRVLLPPLSVEEGEEERADEEGRGVARRPPQQQQNEQDVQDVQEGDRSYSGISTGTDQTPLPSSEGTLPVHLHDSRLELCSRPRISIKHHARVAELAPQLLAFAADGGITCCFFWVLDFSLEHVYYGDLVAVFHAATAVGGPTGLPLLHRVVRSGNARLLRLLLARAAAHGFACNMAQAWGPFLITPLHLAALQPLNTSLLHACHSAGPHVAQLWDMVTDAAGRTPAAYLKNKRKKVLLSGASAGSADGMSAGAIGDGGSQSAFMYDRSWGSEDNVGEAAVAPSGAGVAHQMAMADVAEAARRAFEGLPNNLATGELLSAAAVAFGAGGGTVLDGDALVHGSGDGSERRVRREGHVPDSVEDFRERPDVWGPLTERGLSPPVASASSPSGPEGQVAGGVAATAGGAAPMPFWSDSAEDWLGVQKRLQSLQQEDENTGSPLGPGASAGGSGCGVKGVPKGGKVTETGDAAAKRNMLASSDGVRGGAAGGLNAGERGGLVTHVAARRAIGLASVVLVVAVWVGLMIGQGVVWVR